jgi:hypothetical protein
MYYLEYLSLFILNLNFFLKCFKYCGCGLNETCNYCNSDYFIGYDMFNSGSSTKYDLVNSSLIAPNTNGLTCTKSNVEIQVH